MVQNIIVAIVLVLVAIYVVRYVYKTFTGKSSGCGCSSDACSSCPEMQKGSCDDEDKGASGDK